MLAKPLLLALLAACGVPSSSTAAESPAGQPDEWKPPEKPEEDGQHFCCETLDAGASGNGCVMIGKEHTAACDKILYCGGSWKKEAGKVTCLD